MSISLYVEKPITDEEKNMNVPIATEEFFQS